MIKVLPAMINKDTNGGYEVSFPDFPGCTATDPSFDNVQKKAEGALQLYVDRMLATGEVIPEPSSIIEVSEMVHKATALFVCFVKTQLPSVRSFQVIFYQEEK